MVGARLYGDVVWLVVFFATFVMWVIALRSLKALMQRPSTKPSVVALAEQVVEIESIAGTLIGERGERASEIVAHIQLGVASLEKLRDTDTAEYIDLFADQMRSFVAGEDWPDGETKRARMDEIERRAQTDFERLGIRGPARSWTK